MSIEFADPPNRKREGTTVWATVVEELKARPGEWAIVCRGTGTTRFQSTHQYLRRVYGLEVTCRTVDGENRLYARWPEGKA